MRHTLLLIILLVVSFVAEAQKTFTFSKEEVMAKVPEQNGSIKIFEQTILEAKGDFWQTYAVLFPNLGKPEKTKIKFQKTDKSQILMTEISNNQNS